MPAIVKVGMTLKAINNFCWPTKVIIKQLIKIGCVEFVLYTREPVKNVLGDFVR